MCWWVSPLRPFKKNLSLHANEPQVSDFCRRYFRTYGGMGVEQVFTVRVITITYIPPSNRFHYRPSSDEFYVRATVDIESEDVTSKDTLENQLRYFISNSRAFNPGSPLTVIDKGFDITQGK